MAESFNLNLLRAFFTLYNEKNVTRAGKKLNITQSAMSNALNQMRREFNDPLFIREKYGMRPTPRATEIAMQVEPILNDIDNVVNTREAFIPESTERVFTIAVTNITSYLLLPYIVELIHKRAPHSELLVHDCDPFNYDQNFCDQRNIELCIGMAGKLPSTASSEVLLNAKAVTIGRKDHPLLQGEFTMKKFLEARHMLVKVTGQKLAPFIDTALEEKGLKREIELTVPYPTVGAKILAKSDMLTTIPGEMINAFKNNQDLKIVETPIEIPVVDMLQVWHNRFDRDPGHVWMRELVRDAVELSQQ